MKRRSWLMIGATAGILVGVLVVTGLAAWWWIRLPIYHPGAVRAGGPVTVPTQTTEGRFRMEDDVELRYEARGRGPTVLFLHGGPGVPIQGYPAGLEALANRGFQVVVHDQRGCGQSTRPFDRFESHNYWRNLKTLESTLGVAAQIMDIERIRRILGAERLLLVGHSYGAILAGLYAVEFPEHVGGLVLVSPADLLVMPQDDGGALARIRAGLRPERVAEFDRWQTQYLDFANIFSASERDLAERHAAFAGFYAEAMGHEAVAVDTDSIGGWMVAAQYFSLGMSYDFRPFFAKVDAPVLVLHGSADLQSAAVSQDWADAFAAGRFESLEGTHFTHVESPEQFAALVAPFFTSALGPVAASDSY